jgi:hypothetical protein
MSELNDRPADASTVAVETRPEPAELDAEARAEPLSRDEYADSMRQGPPAEIDEDENEEDNDADGDENASDDAGSDAQEMTREEYADDVRQGPSAETGEADRDEEPEPAGDRHDKSQVADEAAWDDPATEAQGMTRDDYADSMRQEPAAEADEPETSQPAETDRLDRDETEPPAAEQDRPEPEQDSARGEDPYAHLSVVRLEPVDRTLGDTSPTGIGLKPTGEQLGEMDGDKLTRGDRFRKNFYRKADDIQDATEKNADAFKVFLGEHRPTGHDEALAHQPVFDAPQPPPLDAANIATAGLVAGMVTDRAIQWARQWFKRPRG